MQGGPPVHCQSCFPSLSPNRPSPLSSSLRSAGGCERTRTAQGRGRYFVRLALQGKVLAVAVRQLAQTPRLLQVRHGGGGATHEWWAAKQRRNLCYFTGFSFMIQGAPSSAVKISEVRWWLTRGRMQPVLWHCTAAGEGEESTVIFLIQT